MSRTAGVPPRSRGRQLGRAALAMAAFAVPVALLAFAVRQKFDPLVRLDDTLIRRLTDFTREHDLVDVLLLVQTVSQPILLYVLASGVALWAWLARGLRARALWGFVTMMVAWNIGLAVKAMVARARPVVDDPISHSPGYSFPSGHAFNSAVVATVLVFMLWPALSTLARRVVVVLAVASLLVIGLDRMLLGVHFPSDVLAGQILGVGITFSSWLGFIGKTSAISSPGPSHPV